MKASVIDLRTKMSKIIKALDRNERITLMYHGKEKALIIPIKNETHLKISEHPFFGMNRDSEKPVEKQMTELRNGRYNDL